MKNLDGFPGDGSGSDQDYQRSLEAYWARQTGTRRGETSGVNVVAGHVALLADSKDHAAAEVAASLELSERRANQQDARPSEPS